MTERCLPVLILAPHQCAAASELTGGFELTAWRIDTYPSSSTTAIALYICWRLPPPHYQPHISFYLRLLSTILKLNDFKSCTNDTSFLPNFAWKWKGYWYICTKRVPNFLFSLHFSAKTCFSSTTLSLVYTTTRFTTTSILFSSFLQSICYVNYDFTILILPPTASTVGTGAWV